MAVGKLVYKESDGKAVDVDLLYTVEAQQLAVVDGWAGITVESGDSGDTIALDLAQVERQWEVPASLSVSKGDIVYLEVADVTGHTPDDTAYSTTAGEGKIALFKATTDKDDNNVVLGITLGHLAS
jgi:outer membrane protein assembly factor BamB